jgi:CpeT protein
MVFKFDGEQFVGTVEGCNCLVEREGKKTYVKNSTYLGEDTYKVYDRGYEVDTDEYIWGSRWGHFVFIRIDKEPIWIEG